MIKQFKISIFLGFLFFLYNTFTINAQEVEVYISDIRSVEGLVVIGVFKDHQSFKDDTPIRRLKFNKSNMIKGKMIVKLELVPGRYGLALLDDENNDDIMNFNMIGVPKEGYGFSNYYLKGLSRPKFDCFCFDLKVGQTKRVICKMKYML